MRAIIFNDTSRFHAGSAAVMRALHGAVRDAGIEILESVYGNTWRFENAPPRWEPLAYDEADLVIVNGEGTMHDNSRMASFLMQRIADAVPQKKVALVNSLWQNMGPAFTALLDKTDLLIAREPASARAMAASHALVMPDLSFFEIPVLSTRPRTGFVKGTFYRKAFRKLELDDGIDIERQDWSVIVNRLRSADVLFTGKHHEVYAACLARCPFVAAGIATHKVEALGAFIGRELPILPADADARTVQLALTEAAADAGGLFADLFDRLEEVRAQRNLADLLTGLA